MWEGDWIAPTRFRAEPMRIKVASLQFARWPSHEGKEEEKEEEKERIVVHNSSRNCALSGDWNICWSCVSFGGPVLAPTRVARQTPRQHFWLVERLGESL
jgi:hypothetical protein